MLSIREARLDVVGAVKLRERSWASTVCCWKVDAGTVMLLLRLVKVGTWMVPKPIPLLLLCESNGEELLLGEEEELLLLPML